MMNKPSTIHKCTKRCDTTMLRRTTLLGIEHDGRCYEETRDLRIGYTRCPLTGGEPSLSRLPSGTPVERGQHPSSRFSSRRAVATQRRTEDEAGSPRVADRSGSVAVLPSSPLVPTSSSAIKRFVTRCRGCICHVSVQSERSNLQKGFDRSSLVHGIIGCFDAGELRGEVEDESPMNASL
jgi:hypothetical protein